MKRAAGQRDLPQYPRIEARFGENPARFLATGLDPIPRVRGIVDLGLCNMYLRAARDLDCEQRVVDAIERRRDFLVEQEAEP